MANPTTGFVFRTKGKQKIHQLYLGAGGLVNQGITAPGVWTNAGAPSNGTGGTLAGVTQPGDLLVDVTNFNLYMNGNTQLSPTWTLLSAGAALSNPTVTGLLALSVAAALTASTTHTQIGALALTKQINQVSTVANASDAVALAALTPGQWQDVYNDGAHAMAVWPASGQNIDGAGANTAVTLTNAKRCRYTCVATNTIESSQLGVVSA